MARPCGYAWILLCLCLSLSACAVSDPVRQRGASFSPAPLPAPLEEEPAEVPSVPPAAQPLPYPDLGVYFDGLLTDKGYLVEDTLYLSPATICGFFGLELTAEADNAFSVSGPGLSISAASGQEYVLANGRYLYTPQGAFVADGRLYLPADAIEKLLGVRVVPEEDGSRVEIAGGGLILLQGGEDYYTTKYNSEDLFWLSRIIYAESHGEPLAGMIGVGQVVLNRVESPEFPSTIYTVVFDDAFAVQFEPTATGGVYEEPDEPSVVAACLALEGTNTVGDSLFFVNPDKGSSAWFDKALTPTVTIGRHHFYSLG